MGQMIICYENEGNEDVALVRFGFQWWHVGPSDWRGLIGGW